MFMQLFIIFLLFLKIPNVLHCSNIKTFIKLKKTQQHGLYCKAIKHFLSSHGPHSVTWWATFGPWAFSLTYMAYCVIAAVDVGCIIYCI